VIVNNFYVEGITVFPNKADAPLVVDANAVLPFSVALERLKAIAGRNLQVSQDSGSTEHSQFSKCHPLNVPGQFPRPFSLEKVLGLFVFKTSDHPFTL
jgi:hypothetical protein